MGYGLYGFSCSERVPGTYKIMKILVTGGAGFIGSNVVDAYVAGGHEVVVVDDLSSGKEANLNPAASFHQMDIRSGELTGLVTRIKPDVVNHHAAQISVPLSTKDPVFDAEVNVIGLLNLLEASRKASVKKVIFASSGGALYGEAESRPTGEDAKPSPASPYAISKLASEYYLGYYQETYGIDYTVLRYANVYGERQTPHGEAGVISIFIDKLLNGKPCTVNRFPEEERGMTRDYCYVGDVVKANLLALERASERAVNIATGIETHTLDLFKMVYLEIKSRLPLQGSSLEVPLFAPARAGDIRRSSLCTRLALSDLGWKAETELKRGIEKTALWNLSNPNLK